MLHCGTRYLTTLCCMKYLPFPLLPLGLRSMAKPHAYNSKWLSTNFIYISVQCLLYAPKYILQLCLSLPEGRCSHTTVVWQKGIIIAGGMNPSLQPLSSCLYLSHTMSCGWNLSYFNISPILPPKSVEMQLHNVYISHCTPYVHQAGISSAIMFHSQWKANLVSGSELTYLHSLNNFNGWKTLGRGSYNQLCKCFYTL